MENDESVQISRDDLVETALTEGTARSSPSERQLTEPSDSPSDSLQEGSAPTSAMPDTASVIQAVDQDTEVSGADSMVPSEDSVPEKVMTPDDTPPLPVRGRFETSSIGEPGRAATTVVPKFDAKFPEVADVQAHGSGVRSSDTVIGLTVRAVSLSGLSHRYSGKARQDSYALAQSEDARYFVCAVADGLGSAPSSHLAAVAASRAAVDEAAKWLDGISLEHMDSPDRMDSLDQMDWSSIMGTASDAIRGAAPSELRTASLQLLMKELCTTLVIAAIPVAADVDGLRRAVISRIGDSSAWILDPEDGFRSIGSVKNDGASIAGSGTSALPSSPPIGVDTVVVDLKSNQVLLLVSDGLGDPLASGTGEVGRTLKEWWAEPPALFEFIGQADFARKSFDDDRTVVAVWPTGSK